MKKSTKHCPTVHNLGKKPNTFGKSVGQKVLARNKAAHRENSRSGMAKHKIAV